MSSLVSQAYFTKNRRGDEAKLPATPPYMSGKGTHNTRGGKPRSTGSLLMKTLIILSWVLDLCLAATVTVALDRLFA